MYIKYIFGIDVGRLVGIERSIVNQQNQAGKELDSLEYKSKQEGAAFPAACRNTC